jgi:segregation and condensation protein A
LVNVAEITDQYMAYVELMEASQFELAAEYLVMASMLAEIKSRILLPRQEELNEEESDPRLDLLKRLQEYEKFKIAAEGLDKLPRIERDLYPTKAAMPVIEKITVEPEVDLHEMLSILSKALRRADMFESHQIQRDTLSTREKMSEILLRINSENFVPLFSLLSQDEGRLGVVVTFLAIMELLKDSMIEIVQSGPYAAIHVKQC